MRGYGGCAQIVRYIFCIACLIFISIPFIAEAFEPDLEKELQQSLIQSRAIVLQALQRQKDTSSIDEEIIKLKDIAERIKINHALLQERFRLRQDAVNQLGGNAEQRHRGMEAGYLKALGEYLNLSEQLNSAQPSAISSQLQQGSSQPSALSNQLNSLKTLLDSILPKSKRPIFGSLPYKNLNYPAREPDASLAIKPAYKGGNKVVSPDDTKDTPEAPLSLEIATLAQTLNWKPVAIYEYVKNNIETEWYWGCQKGAEETLRQKSGNDCDQATLLTALLRASGFPTRYVRGTIEFFAGGRDGVAMDKIKNLTGIGDPLKIAEFFQKAGVPYKPVIQGGKIANFQLEHIWVESYIPYGNYRGTMIDNSAPRWLGLDSSIKPKGYTYNNPRDIMAVVPLAGLGDVYLKTSGNTMEPLEYIKTSLEGYLTQAYPSVTYNDLLRTKTLIPESMKILPNTLQFEQKKITHEYIELPDELKHKVRFAAKDKHGSELFDLQLSTFQLSNKRVALTYEPETVEDQQIIDSYGGLDNTPAYLVRLRPVLKVNGERIIVGKDGLGMGEDYKLAIELLSPNGTETITNTHITGNLAAIGIVAQKARPSAPSPLEGEGGGEGDKDAETILYKEANRYIDRWNQAEDELASLLHLNITRPIPTVVTVGGVIDVTYLLDMPHGFEWKGVFIDANLRALSVVPTLAKGGVGGFSDDRKKTFMQLAGLQGSILENRIFEDDFQAESISTAKLIQLANSRQIPILSLNNTNIGSTTLPFDTGIVDDLKNAVNQNLLARIPNQEMTYRDWTGTGYTKEDLQTNESGYMLSGMLASSSPDLSGIAGGMTAVSPDKWLNQNLVEILGRPYAGQYTTISITSPKNESVLFASPITVSGMALDPNSRVTVNGLEAAREGNTFTAAGISLMRGMNRITATATNSEGVSVSSSINVKYRLLLRTFITFPYEGANLSVQSVDVEGIVSDPAATVEINGINAVVSTDGRFIARGIALSEGSNQITVRATNPEGDVDIQTITVTRQATQAEPIQLTITSPTGNEAINRPSVLVKGTVATTAEEVWIKVNGQLAEVHNGQFVANHVPLVEGANVIIVNAIDSNGGVGRAEVSVTANRAAPHITLNANTTSGIPPITTYFTVNTEIPNSVTSYQMDFEGDGIVDYSGTTFEDISHTYTTEGIYYPTVIVTDDQGNVYTDVIAITVLSKAKIEAVLKEKWTLMTNSLTVKDTETALTFIASGSRSSYEEMFNALYDQLPEITATQRELKLIYITDNVAKYKLVTFENNQYYAYEVTFVKDAKGTWKILQY